MRGFKKRGTIRQACTETGDVAHKREAHQLHVSAKDWLLVTWGQEMRVRIYTLQPVGRYKAIVINAFFFGHSVPCN